METLDFGGPLRLNQGTYSVILEVHASLVLALSVTPSSVFCLSVTLFQILHFLQFFQVLPNSFKSFQVFSGPFKFSQILSSLFMPFQVLSIPCKYFQILSSTFNFYQVLSYPSKSFQVLSSPTMSLQVLPYNLKAVLDERCC